MIERRDKRIEKQQDRIGDLETQVNNLSGEVKRLSKELRKHVNENTPSSAVPSFNKEPPHYHNKTPGREEGHEGSGRKLPEDVDEVKDAEIDRCPDCNSEVTDAGFHDRTIETVVPARVKAVKIHVHRYWCPCCKKMINAPVKDAFSNSRFGIETYLLIAFFKEGLGLTYGKIVELLRIAYGLDLSKGALPQMLDTLRDEFGDYYNELLEELRKSPYSNNDETSWRKNGKNWWLWAFVGKWVTFYTIDKSRGKNVPKRVLGKNYEGVVGSDFLGPYNYVGKIWQKCQRHLDGDLKETAKTKPKGSDFFPFKKRLKRILKIMFMEDAYSKSSNYEEKAVADNNLFEAINDHYVSLLNSGLSQKEAEQKCRVDVQINTDDFRKTLIIGCAIRRIKFMAIEAHSEEGSKISTGFVSDLNAPGKPGLQDLLSNNVPLKVLAKYNLDVDKQTMGSTIFRDHDIVSGLNQRFDQAIKLFPELGTEHEVRAMGVLGIAHEPIYYEFDHSNKRLSFTKEEYVDWDSILQRVFVENQKDDTKPITMRQAELISIDQIWSMPATAELKATNSAIVTKAINKIMTISQEQLEQLDSKAPKSNIDDRGRFLLRSIVDTNYVGRM